MKWFKFNHFGIAGTKNIYNTEGNPYLNKIFEVANYIGIFILKNKNVRNKKNTICSICSKSHNLNICMCPNITLIEQKTAYYK